jgi:hypothetical protein
MALEKTQEPAEGCLTWVVRGAVRAVVLVVVVPVRMVWEVLAGLGRLLRRTVLRPAGRVLAWVWHVLVAVPLAWLYPYVLRPLGRGARLLAWALLVWPATALWRWVLVPLGRFLAVAARRLHDHLLAPLAQAAAWLAHVLLAVPMAWLYRAVLTPLGRGLLHVLQLLAIAVARLLAALLVWPWILAWRYLLLPAAHGIATAARWLHHHVLAPLAHCARHLATALAALLWRLLLKPLGLALLFVLRELAEAVLWSWQVAGRILRWLARTLLLIPLRWAYHHVLTPVGHALRAAIWRPAASVARAATRATRQALATARQTARQAGRELRQVLFGRGGGN